MLEACILFSSCSESRNRLLKTVVTYYAMECKNHSPPKWILLSNLLLFLYLLHFQACSYLYSTLFLHDQDFDLSPTNENILWLNNVHCSYAPLFNPFIHQWTFQLSVYFDFCKSFANKYTSQVPFRYDFISFAHICSISIARGCGSFICSFLRELLTPVLSDNSHY